jgi:hypothetical protein
MLIKKKIVVGKVRVPMVGIIIEESFLLFSKRDPKAIVFFFFLEE